MLAMLKFRPMHMLVLVWLPIAVAYPLAIARGVGWDVLAVLPSGIAAMLTGGVLGIGIWMLSGRVPLPVRPNLRFYVGLLSAGFAYAILWVGVSNALQGWLAGRTPSETLLRTIGYEWLQWDILFGFSLFGLLAGTSYALRAQESVAEERLRASRAAELAAAARLRALQARLKPHFLFNALHSLTEVVRESPPEAEEALERLGNVMRYLVDRGDLSLVPLAEELGFARDYVAIERYRFGTRLRVEECVDADALDAEVPAFCIQPLVENALRHGLSPVPEGGTLFIGVSAHGGTVTVQIRDDGIGADPDVLRDRAGVGLETLPQRLESLPAGPGAMRVRSSPGEGFTVTLQLPRPAPSNRADEDGTPGGLPRGPEVAVLPARLS